jgi:5-(carboxyamino)imidazole ribonucleotide synthase
VSAAPRPRVGILGGGQLALMLAESLVRLGADPAIFDPDVDAPARRRYAEGASNAYEDREALRRFLDGCDVVTYEFENVPAAAIRAARSTTKILPSLDVLETCQHRGREKRAIRAAGVPTVEFVEVEDAAALPAALRKFGLPAIVKTARGGYDGKGQRRYDDLREVSRDDFPAGAPLVIEEVIAIERELSVIVARTADRAVCLPLFENRHRAHILDVTLCPAGAPAPLARKAQSWARKLATALDVTGLLTVELFVGRGRSGRGLYVNELAPRPHNSGHVSRIACDLSQFDLLAHAVLGLPLRVPRLVRPGVAVMANLLGDRWPAPSAERRTFGAVVAQPSVEELYLYGKRAARPGRKMGHVSGFARDAVRAVAWAERIRRRAGLSGPRSSG